MDARVHPCMHADVVEGKPVVDGGVVDAIDGGCTREGIFLKWGGDGGGGCDAVDGVLCD